MTGRYRRRYLRRRLGRDRKLAGTAIAAGLLVALIYGHPAGRPGTAAPPAGAVLAAGGGGGSEALANSMAAAGPYYWGPREAACLDALWSRESGFSATAVNGQTGATGIPQLNPAYHVIPANWSDPATQVRWGLAYIRATYGTPCGAWSHEEAASWY